MEFITAALAAALILQAVAIGYFHQRTVKTLVDHMRDTAVVGGQPVQIALKNQSFQQEKEKKAAEARKKNRVSLSEVIGG